MSVVADLLAEFQQFVVKNGRFWQPLLLVIDGVGVNQEHQKLWCRKTDPAQREVLLWG